MGWLQQKEVVLQWIESWKYSSFIINKYSHTAFIFLGFIILAWLVRHIYKVVFLRIARKTLTKIDDQLIEATKWPASLVVLMIGVKVAIIPLQLSEKISGFINHAADSLIIIIIAIIATQIINIFVDAWGKKFTEKTKSETDDQLLVMVHRFFKVFFVILALLFIMNRWGIQIGPLLASLGIAGIAIGFAVKDSLTNIFGGIQLIIDKTFKVGDKIELGDGTVGVVQDISLRSTRIRTFDNELIIIPNGKMANESIKNHVQPELKVRVLVPFSVEYGSDPKKVRKVVLDALKKLDNVMKEPEPDVLFMEMADFSLNFRAQYWVPSYDKRFMSKVQANNLVYDALNKAGIGIPFPTRTVYLKNTKKKKK